MNSPLPASINNSRSPGPTTPAAKPFSSKEGKNKFVRIVLIALGVLLIIIISEVSYLVAFHGYGKELFQKTTTLSPTPTPTVPTIQDIENSLPKKVLDIDKAREFTTLLGRIEPKWDALLSANLNISLEGTVVYASEVVTEEGKSIFSIDIESKSGKLVNIALTPAEVDQSLTIIYSKGLIKEGLLTEQIKPGDRVRIRLIMNALDTSPEHKVILEIERD